MLIRRAPLVLLLAALSPSRAGCGPGSVVGKWVGATNGCTAAANNGLDVTLEMTNSRTSDGKADASSVTLLGQPAGQTTTATVTPVEVERDSNTVNFLQTITDAAGGANDAVVDLLTPTRDTRDDTSLQRVLTGTLAVPNEVCNVTLVAKG